MARLRPTSPKTPAALVLLIVAQVFCAAFFIGDLVADFLDAGAMVTRDVHFHFEALASAVLVVSVLFGIRVLMRLLRRKAHLETSLGRASAAIHDVIEAHFEDWGLTPAEQDVATFLVKGLTTAEIAGMRGSAEGTVKAHLHAIYRKSGTRNRAEVLSVLIDSLMAEAERPEATGAGGRPVPG